MLSLWDVNWKQRAENSLLNFNTKSIVFSRACGKYLEIFACTGLLFIVFAAVFYSRAYKFSAIHQ